jgi:hypothetical protein
LWSKYLICTVFILLLENVQDDYERSLAQYRPSSGARYPTSPSGYWTQIPFGGTVARQVLGGPC